ncbi:hypothetical protein [Listeria sp. ILCC797]|uniref:hypothetical protein n=1 Tax=Listeria sp. ILCC797 TaxID=1918333 RepID=UPI000B58BEA9|nr:hypothetical protein [Listeria sp. ILCC797]
MIVWAMLTLLVVAIGMVLVNQAQKKKTRTWVYRYLEQQVYTEETEVVGFHIKRKREAEGLDYVVTAKIQYEEAGEWLEDVETLVMTPHEYEAFQRAWRYNQKLQKIEKHNLKRIH